MEIFALSGLINGILSLISGLFVILKNRRERINQLFFLLTFSIAVWAFGYWRWFSSDYESIALFWIRIASIGSIFIPIFLFHWITVLLGISKEQKYFIKLAYLAGIFLSLFSFSDLFIEGINFRLGFPFWPKPAILYHFYLIFIYIGLILYSFILLSKAYKISDSEKKGRIFYVFLGGFIGFSGGFTNFFLWYGIPILPYGNFAVAVFPFLFGYSMFKHHLFNIKVIATELLTFAIWSFIFVRIILAESMQEIISNSILLLLTIIFGYLLILSVRKEIRQREQLEILTKELEDKNIKLQELDKIRLEFLSFASHQIRAPMTIVKGYASLIYEGSYGEVLPVVKETARKIGIFANQLINLVNNFLDMRRIEEGKIDYKFEEINIVPLISDLVENFKIVANQKGLVLNFESDKPLVKIRADEEKLKQVFQNLIDNALKYTKEGRIKISVKDEGETALIAVEDTGRGISSELTPKLFERFSRDEAIGKEIQGTGLGLYIAKEIIKAHNGKIWAESEGLGKGSKFLIRLEK